MTKFLTTLALIFGVNLEAAPAQERSIQLTPANTVVFRDEVTASSVSQVQQELAKLDKLRGNKNYPIYLVLDCPGGSIFAGQAFIEYAKTIKNLKTVTIFAASMCSGIVQQLQGERLAADNAVMMFHRAHAGVEGYLNDGELEEMVRFIKNVVLDMEIKNANRMGIDYQTYKNRIATEWWMYGSEVVTNKAADRSVALSCSSELIETKQVIEVETLFGSISVEFSGCPLFRSPISIKEGE